MQHTPSEVFHYTDSGGHSDAVHLSKSCTILQAAKKDLLGIIQLQVTGLSQKINKNIPLILDISLVKPFLCVLQDPSLLEGRVTLHQVKAGSVVARQGDQVRRTNT